MTERLRVRIPAGVAEEFSSLESTLCADSFGVRFTPVLPQGHLKDPDHYAKSAGGRLHLNTHTLLTRRSRSGLTVPLSRHTVGAYQETRSRATRQGTLGHSRLSSLRLKTKDPGLKRGLSVRELISTLKKKAHEDNELSNILPNNLRKFGKSHHHLRLIRPQVKFSFLLGK